MRALRPNLPGMPFHLISRTIGREPWLATFRDQIVSMFAFAFAHTDARLHAYIIMNNHFHLIVRQGLKPLAALMQPLCRKIALRTQRLHSREGHIFERRFRSIQLSTPQHLRLAIAYIHRNPVKAGLCDTPAAYRWSSQWAYEGREPPANVQCCLLPVTAELELFASRNSRSLQQRLRDYARYSAWCAACSKLAEYELKPAEPSTAAGDEYWSREYNLIEPLELPLPDLCEFVRVTLSEVALSLTPFDLRMKRGGEDITRARHEIIKRAVLAGFRRADIARELNVAESTVSKHAKSLFMPGRAAQPQD